MSYAEDLSRIGAQADAGLAAAEAALAAARASLTDRELYG